MNGLLNLFYRSKYKINGTDITLNDIATPIADFAMGSKQFTGLAIPTVDTNAATKLYVDQNIAGLNWKDSVRVATTANGT